MATHAEVIDFKVEFPFDLNNLFNLTYSFDVLKQAIDFLAQNQAIFQSSLNDAEDHKETDKSQDKNGGGNIQSQDSNKLIRDHENVIKNLRHELNQVKDHVGQHDKLHKDHQKELESQSKAIEELQKSLQDHTNKIAEAESSILLLKSLGSTGQESNGKPGFLDALEALVDKLRKECEQKYGAKDDLMKFKKRIDALEDQLKYEIRDVNGKIDNQSNSISQCRDITDTNKLDVDDLKKMLKDLKKSISGNESSASLVASDSKTSTNINNRVPSASNNKGKDMKDVKQKLKDLEDQLKKKVDQDVFDNEVALLRQMIGNSEPDETFKPDLEQIASPSTNNSLNSQETKMVRELLEKFPNLEEMLQKLLNDMKNMNLQMFKDQINQLFKLVEKLAPKDHMFTIEREVKEIREIIDIHDTEMKELHELINGLKGQMNAQPASQVSTNDIMMLRSRMEYIESQTSSIKKSLIEIKKVSDEGKDGEDVEGADEVWLKELDSDLQKFKSEFYRFREEMIGNYKQLQDHLNAKVDKDELSELEARLLEKLNEMIKKMMGQFADKAETKKRLAALEKNVKIVFEMLGNRGSVGRGEHEEDAMFSKKPLGGFSCASCERNITNLQGHMADYQPWKKLPFREPNDRIARYGPGFSKILSMMRPDQMEHSRIEQVTQNKRTLHEDFNSNSHNNSTIQEHSIMVEMPSGVSAKNSARTGNHFYKPSYSGNKTVVMKQFAGMEESPPRVMNHENSQETLPNLNIKGGIQRSGQGQMH